MKSSTDLFAAQGRPWNHPNYQYSAGLVITSVRGPSWHELDHHWIIEGYGPDGDPERPRNRWHVPRPQGVNVHDERRRECAKLMPKPEPWRPEGVHYRRKEELQGKAQPLTEDQLRVRARQRAQVKARLTRAENKRKKERREVLDILLNH